MVGAEHIKPGAAVVDVGIHRKPEGGLCGDVVAEEVEPIAAALSPVPGRRWTDDGDHASGEHGGCTGADVMAMTTVWMT